MYNIYIYIYIVLCIGCRTTKAGAATIDATATFREVAPMSCISHKHGAKHDTGESASKTFGNMPRGKVREAMQTGVRQVQQRAAGRRKVGKAKVKVVKPVSAFVLVYTLGDEMYKWTRSSSL